MSFCHQVHMYLTFMLGAVLRVRGGEAEGALPEHALLEGVSRLGSNVPAFRLPAQLTKLSSCHYM